MSTDKKRYLISQRTVKNFALGSGRNGKGCFQLQKMEMVPVNMKRFG